MIRSKEAIQESLDALEALEQQHQNTPQEVRLKMLRLLKENPSRTFNEVGLQIGCSERSIQRWWATYQEQGLEGLISAKPRSGGRPKRIGNPELRALQQKARLDGFSKLQEAQRWLHEQHGIHYSQSSVWNLMRTTLKAEPGGWDIPQEEEKESPSPSHTNGSESPVQRIPNHIIGFLNALPTSGDTLEWINMFCAALRELLGDIDRISLNINAECRLNGPEGDEPDTIISQITSASIIADAPAVVSSAPAEARPSERILENLRRQYSLTPYQKPHCYDYYHNNEAYLGTIILWREVHKASISQDTLNAMAVLEPFIIFALSDLVARHQAERPIDRIFYDTIDEMVAEAQLTRQEKRIVILRLMGHSYKDLADNVHVSINTVKKHLTQIHRKTATAGMAELFAKYFSSRLIPTEIKEDRA